MNKLTHQFWAKAVAVFLFAIVTLLALFSFAGIMAGLSFTRGDLAYTEYWIRSIGYTASISMGWVVAAALLFTILSIALFVFLLSSAGKRRGSEEFHLSRLDRVPFDLLLTIVLFAYFALFAGMRGISDLYFTPLSLLPAGALTAAGILLTLMLFVTFAARVKTGTLWRNNVIAYILVFSWRLLAGLFRNLSLLWKGILVYLAFGLLCMWLYSSAMHDGAAVLLFLLVTAAMLAALCFAALQLQQLQEGAQALAGGDLAHRIDTKGMHLDIKAHADALNGIGDGMRIAVEERMKSERMKTDLIANVSHDLKTPLTSIVNYVDLLQKEELGNDTAKGYVEVLSRQAQRLKKLTTDIVDASKASSGAISVSLTPTDVKEILHQSLAEYAERLAAADVTPVVRIADGLPSILADGRLAWRVMDNLLNNALKYALPGTRLYCDAAMQGGRVSLTLKNISREPIGVPAAELTERFVRGDSARTSEGSGLGLSIAKSLMELQKGELKIDADGDLFKATLCFTVA